MKIILVVLLTVFLASPASAYLEDNREGETQLTAGEQNSSYHRLSSRGAEALKKLKQADEYIERVQASGRRVNAAALEDLLNSEQKDRNEQEMGKLIASVRQQSADPSKLKITYNHDTFEILSGLQTLQQKDKETARQLALQLSRRPK